MKKLREEVARADHQVQGLRERLTRAQRQVPVAEILPDILARRRALFPPLSDVASPATLGESDVLVSIDHVVFSVPADWARKVKVPWELIQKVRAVTVGGIMLDIGANIGQTCVPRILLGDFQVIHAAEPEPTNYARLETAIQANGVSGFVVPERVAIGSRDGALRLRVGHYRSHATVADGDPDSVEVPSLTLDSWIARLGIDPDAISFVKTDTNGGELDVLRGAAGLLSRRRAIWQVEVAPSLMARLNTTLGMLTDELRRHFTHFIDINHKAPGDIVRPIDDLTEALAYLDTMETSRGGKSPQTDLLCLNR